MYSIKTLILSYLADDSELIRPALHGRASLCIVRRMEFLWATDSEPCRRLPQSRLQTSHCHSKAQSLGLTHLVPILVMVALGHGRLLAQDSSADQGWPQSQDAPYAADQGQQSYEQAPEQQPYSDVQQPTRQPLGAEELEQLVAPIALYPDALVAQVLAAATYPQQVADADRWRQGQGYATPDEIASGADAQGWDPSVKALTAFPQVLTQMDRNQQWTTDLGNAYYNQPQDVLEAVQVMRRRAQAAGTLRSSPQEIVRYDAGNIVLAPADPQVVYVPAYNPWAVYGEPVNPYPGFSLLGAIADIAGALPLRYGLGIAISAFTQPWGFLAWGLDWLGHALMFQDSAYFSHSRTVADWGFPHRGFYAYSGRGGFGRGTYGRAHAWGGESWRRGGSNSGGWHGFSRGPERGSRGFETNRGFAANRGGFESRRGFEANRGFESSRGFQSFRSERGGFAQPKGRVSESRGAYGSEFNRGAQGFRRAEGFRGNESYRASAGTFPRNEFRGNEFRGVTSERFGESSVKSHSGGLFGGGHSHNTFASIGHSGHSGSNFGGGHSSLFHGGGGHAPKISGGGHSFGGGKSFGGGGHSHGGGGHSHGGGGGGKHHH